ncbi:MAG: ribbon-helix-helix protein, CopG family [Candidatus Marinimicrobia bacterium]|nr:ribbon-helix-helix protein, CopG family [Candidatus Neomarinimicrobiota bacterium]
MNTATTLRLPEKELKALRMIAALEGKTMSKIIQDLVEEYLEDYFDIREAKEALQEEGEIPWSEVKKQWRIED